MATTILVVRNTVKNIIALDFPNYINLKMSTIRTKDSLKTKSIEYVEQKHIKMDSLT